MKLYGLVLSLSFDFKLCNVIFFSTGASSIFLLVQPWSERQESKFVWRFQSTFLQMILFVPEVFPEALNLDISCGVCHNVYDTIAFVKMDSKFRLIYR